MIPIAPGFWRPSSVGCGNQAITLLYLDGANNSTSFPDDGTESTTWTTTGVPKISTSHYPSFGTSSLSMPGGTTERVYTSADANHYILNGDYTVEAFVYLNALSPNTNGYVIASRWYQNGFPGDGWFLAVLKSGSTMYLSWAYPWLEQAQSNFSVPLTTWTHIAACRKGTQHYFSCNGSTETFGITNRTTESANAEMSLGYDLNSPIVSTVLNGYLSNVRITRCARYVDGSYTVPTDYFPIP